MRSPTTSIWLLCGISIPMLDIVAMPRNQSRVTTNVTVPSKTYDRLRALTPGRQVQQTVDHIIRWFVALPPDARETLLSSISRENQAKVLRAVLEEMKARSRK